VRGGRIQLGKSVDKPAHKGRWISAAVPSDKPYKIIDRPETTLSKRSSPRGAHGEFGESVRLSDAFRVSARVAGDRVRQKGGSECPRI